MNAFLTVTIICFVEFFLIAFLITVFIIQRNKYRKMLKVLIKAKKMYEDGFNV